MNPSYIFISHASKDDEFVKELRLALEAHQLPVWVDSRKLCGGAKLAPEINEAIEQARQAIVVLSSNTINSPWARREIQKALEVEQQRKDEGYRVIPLLLPSVEPSALALWFDEEPVGVCVELKAGLRGKPRLCRGTHRGLTYAAVEKDEASYSARYLICLPPFSKGGRQRCSRLGRLTVLLAPLRRSPNKPPALPGGNLTF